MSPGKIPRREMWIPDTETDKRIREEAAQSAAARTRLKWGDASTPDISEDRSTSDGQPQEDSSKNG